MMFPITRHQLAAAIGSYGFRPEDGEQVIRLLEGEGRVELTGSMLRVLNPTDPDAPILTGLCRAARGGSSGSVGSYKIREYIQAMLDRAPVHGASRRR